MIQLALAFFGLAALWMAMSADKRLHRWAPIVGLCGQPFWFAFALGAHAWGIVVLVVLYTAVYTHGAWVQWRPTVKGD